MGHANLSNLSEFFIRRLYAKGKLSVQEATDAAIAKNEKLSASEGDYEDSYMVSFGFEQIVEFLLEPVHKINRKSKPSSVIEVCDYDSLTEEQQRVFDLWMKNSDEIMNWDSEKEYQILDSIRFKFADGWRKVYPDIPMLSYVTN